MPTTSGVKKNKHSREEKRQLLKIPTQELLDIGVKKVVWILTKTKKVMIAKRNQKWIVQNWNETFEVFQGIKLNILELVKIS